MADLDSLKLFGFEFKKSKDKQNEPIPSVVPSINDDGAGYVTGIGSGFYAHALNMDGEKSTDNQQMIFKYRSVAMYPEVDMAVEEIVNETISASELTTSVELSLDNVEVSEKIKKTILEEFSNVIAMLQFNDLGHDIFRSWYVDGRLYHHLLVDEKNPKLGIQEVRPIDASKIRKLKKVNYTEDKLTGAKVVKNVEEFFLFEDKPGKANNGVKFSPDAINYVTSGLLDEAKTKVISHLHKAMRSINQLKMMEDSLVIYRLARAPERRIFYIDIGNMPSGRANEYMNNIMAKYRNKLQYDVATGALKDDRKAMSMLEDYWLPRKEGGRGTEISTLPGGENLGQIDDIVYFQKKLYRALNVPVNRLEQEAQFSLGRSTEISRDEIKFQKFIDRLRRKFSQLFLGILRKQLLLKGIITEQDWDKWKNEIVVDFVKDNHFSELKEAEIMRDRVGLLTEVDQFVGNYFSKDWVWRNVLRLSDDEIEDMQKEMEGEEPALPAPGEMEPEEEPAAEPPPAAPKPAEVNINVNGGEPKKKKEETYIPTQEDELLEEMTRYMAKINEQN